MRIGVAIIARATSTRLPRKHFRRIGTRSALELILGRVVREFADEIDAGEAVAVIATGREEENREFAQNALGIPVFFGDDRNIPRRLLMLADSMDLDAIVSVDGDDVLCSPSAMRSVYELLRHGVARAATNGLPFGMNAAGFSSELLRANRSRIDSPVMETGWGRFLSSTPVVTVGYPHQFHPELRMTLDYAEDLSLLSEIAARIGRFEDLSDMDLIDAIYALGLQEINAHLQDEYWQNFHAAVENEERLHE